MRLKAFKVQKDIFLIEKNKRHKMVTGPNCPVSNFVVFHGPQAWASNHIVQQSNHQSGLSVMHSVFASMGS